MDINKVNNFERCCGCAACFNICPQNAISFEKNIKGFMYPKIIKSKCVSCGLCKKVCMYFDK